MSNWTPISISMLNSISISICDSIFDIEFNIINLDVDFDVEVDDMDVDVHVDVDVE